MIVASLYQMPVDPFEQVVSHRPLDYWGRNLLDHLIRMLPEALRRRRHRVHDAAVDHRRAANHASCWTRLGYQARVVDFAFFEFSELFNEQARTDRARRGALRRLPPDVRRDGRDGRLPTRDHPQGKEGAVNDATPTTSILFTSESVTEGHPDKIADQISDGVLDAVLRDDPIGRVACETLVNTGLVVVVGRDHDDDLRRHPGGRARDDRADRLHGRRVRLRLQDVRGDQRDRQAVARHRPGRRRGVRDAHGPRTATTSSTSPARATRG